jgi:lipopolysaccharide biosynthesis protein
MKKTIICHLFYPDLSRKLLHNLAQIDDEETTFLINIQGNGYEQESLYAKTKEKLKNVKIIQTPNKGRDIGAKFCLISLLLQLRIESEYTLIIHDKKSPHLEYGTIWRDELTKIATPRYMKEIFEAFKLNSEAGIVSSAKYIQNEYLKNSDSFACNCSDQIRELLRKYKIELSNYDFVAGNIFWIRTRLLTSFFKNRDIFKIRADLERGNALDFNVGTYIHSWEIIMSWIATSQGYKIYGI